jgi:hypothetical protein
MKFESTAALMTISATNSYTEENDDIPGLLKKSYLAVCKYFSVEHMGRFSNLDGLLTWG